MGLSGWGTAGSVAMMVGMLLLVVLAVAAVALLFRPVFGPEARSDKRQDPVAQTSDGGGPLRLIEDRYARGEMERAEFLERKSNLLGPGATGDKR